MSNLSSHISDLKKKAVISNSPVPSYANAERPMPKHKADLTGMKGMKGMGTDIKNIVFQGVDLSRLSFLFLLSLFIWFLSPVSPSSLLNSALAASKGTTHFPDTRQ